MVQVRRVLLLVTTCFQLFLVNLPQILLLSLPGSYPYAVQNDSKTITKFDKYGNSLGAFGNGWGNESGPNSLAFDKQGNIYVGLSFSRFGSPQFLKFDPNGNLLKTYMNPGDTVINSTSQFGYKVSVLSEPFGLFSANLGGFVLIDLAPDKCTMYYSDNAHLLCNYRC